MVALLAATHRIDLLRHVAIHMLVAKTIQRAISQDVARCFQKFSGGGEEDRTPDLRIANATLSQLSYPPMKMILARKFSVFLSTENPHHFCGEPAMIHSTTVCASAWLIPGCDGIGIIPQTPAPPFSTFTVSFGTAAGSFL